MFLSYFCKPKAVVFSGGESVCCGALRSTVDPVYVCENEDWEENKQASWFSSPTLTPQRLTI